MRIPGSPAFSAFFPSLLLPILVAATGSIDCTHLRDDGVSFDLSKLGGAHSAIHSDDNGVSSTNTTYTLDICRPLGKVKDSRIPEKDQCPNGTRVCAIARLVTQDQDVVEKVIPIAGELKGKGGKDLDGKWERLKSSKAAGDVGKEGIRVTMNGGFTTKDSKTRPQQAIVEFICNKDKTGLENLPNPEDQYEEVKERRDEPESGNNATIPSLQFISYKSDADDTMDILRLEWQTQYACEDSKKEQDEERKSGGWGFFTWFIIVAFLSTAAYLIFGAWLNYNRYGARGWDLLPHGDTIRDVPYLFKDWMRKVVNTVQGPGSRGGYAAV